MFQTFVLLQFALYQVHRMEGGIWLTLFDTGTVFAHYRLFSSNHTRTTLSYEYVLNMQYDTILLPEAAPKYQRWIWQDHAGP